MAAGGVGGGASASRFWRLHSTPLVCLFFYYRDTQALLCGLAPGTRACKYTVAPRNVPGALVGKPNPIPFHNGCNTTLKGGGGAEWAETIISLLSAGCRCASCAMAGSRGVWSWMMDRRPLVPNPRIWRCCLSQREALTPLPLMIFLWSCLSLHPPKGFLGPGTSLCVTGPCQLLRTLGLRPLCGKPRF